ncbi:hypothetical protein N7449_007262 [Penicillium cf. viridicatum]|uniref:Uncharacterized protein n=1 Tax=Penicillium cf. viridicatum TaxID=2972119 RepID=A0A9W9JH09_9EURO|nr:hypothetical protein N7449_007262 [Penicillium cf. viridicatum]
MGSSKYFISWGSERKVLIGRFEPFRSYRHDLVRSYREVLKTAQTFTQHFSKHPLKSYDMERSLSKNMGCDPSAWNKDANSTSICWLDIVRHGDFQKQLDGCYYCFIQGRALEFNHELHDRVEFCRSHAVQISNSGPSCADVEREAEITLDILTDISDELKDLSRCPYSPLPNKLDASTNLTETDTKSLAKLKQAVKIRHSELQSLLDPITIESSGAEATSDDDSEEGSNNSSGDSSEDDKIDDENEDKVPEDKVPEDKVPEDEDMGNMVSEEKGTPDDSCKNVSSQQSNSNSDNGDNSAPAGDRVVPLNPLPLRISSSTSLAGEGENVISTSHISLPDDTEKAVSVNPVPSRDLSPIYLPTESETIPMDHMSPKKGPEPDMDMHLSLPKSPLHDGHKTPLESENPPPRASKRRRFIIPSDKQKKLQKTDHNSTHQERLIAAAWMKANSNKNWNQVTFARKYRIKFGHRFGHTRSYATLKRWMDNEEYSQVDSHIVVLKVPTMRHHEPLSNGNSAEQAMDLSNGNTYVPSLLPRGRLANPQNWGDGHNMAFQG